MVSQEDQYLNQGGTSIIIPVEGGTSACSCLRIWFAVLKNISQTLPLT